MNGMPMRNPLFARADDALEALSIVGRHLPLARAIGDAPDSVVPVVDPRIPLVVARGVGTHPWGERLLGGVPDRVPKKPRLFRQRVELGRAELHVVDPVLFLVEVRRAAGRRLAVSGILDA